MSYYTTNKERVTDSDIDSTLNMLEKIPHFTSLISESEGDYSKYVNSLHSAREVLSVLCSLLSTTDADTYAAKGNNSYYDILKLQAEETRFVKKFSIMHLYFRYSYSSSLDKILAEGLVSDYALMCMAIGMASGEQSDNEANITSKHSDEVYNKLIRTYYGQTPLPRDTRRLFKFWIKECANATIYSPNSPIKANFLQKSAIQNHGFQYVMIGNLLSLELKAPN